MEREAVFASLAAGRRDESSVDQAAQGAARQAQDTFDVPHGVGLHGNRLRSALSAAGLPCRLRRLLDALFGVRPLCGLHVLLRDLDFACRLYVGREAELLHDEYVAHGTQHHNVGVAARGPATDRATTGFAQGLSE